VFDIELPEALARLCIEKGSLAVDGISLTIASLEGNHARFWITPHTWEHTNLQAAKIGQPVNLEADMLAKHVDRLLVARTITGA
jgi:riboflavin synthase